MEDAPPTGVGEGEQKMGLINVKRIQTSGLLFILCF